MVQNYDIDIDIVIKHLRELLDIFPSIFYSPLMIFIVIIFTQFSHPPNDIATVRSDDGKSIKQLLTMFLEFAGYVLIDIRDDNVKIIMDDIISTTMNIMRTNNHDTAYWMCNVIEEARESIVRRFDN